VAHPKDIGDTTTLAVMFALHRRGLSILVPFGENTRYDLAIDDGTRLLRVQCKTGRLRDGAVRFKVCSSYAHHPSPRVRKRDYKGQVDAFAVYCPETGGVYLIPIKDIANNWTGSLRVESPRNSQRVGVRFAGDYLVAKVRATGELAGRSGAEAPCA
jgi:hypothetical protein